MQVIFLPMNQKIEVNKGDNLLKIARSLGIDLNSVCGGNGTCGKCKVLISKGNNQVTKVEQLYLTEEEIVAGARLACFFSIAEDTCVIIEPRPKEKNEEFEEKNDLEKKGVSLTQGGIVFDIGTTSVEAKLYDIEKKKELVCISKSNPQYIYGADVISRITFSNQSEENFLRMHQLIIECCDSIIKEMLRKSGLKAEQIKKLVAVGNTTMSLFLTNNYLKGNKVYTNQIPEIPISVPCTIGGHVGSDTLGCILATEIYKKAGTYLIVDIGTNGEIVLSKNGKLTACSTAAGPAFEGGSISQGMKAREGAISEVEIRENKIWVKVIGDVEPIGICGSGLIDAMAEFLNNGIMDETGRIENSVTLSVGVKGNGVVITQQDIRELQLAKAAIFTGINMLLKKEKVDLKDVDALYLAGTFGNHINVVHAKRVGLLPVMDEEKIKLVGNAALEGASRILNGSIEMDQADEIAKNVSHFELAHHPNFEREYIAAINIVTK